MAARPKTLPAAIAPVAVGSALAFHNGVFQPAPALICLLFALLIQVGANYANDYFDFVQGADSPARVGPTRAVAAGLVSPAAMKFAMMAVLAVAFLVGLLLVKWGGWALVGLGVASVVCAIAYTGGPYPLGYHGWGDVFVLIFFGFIAVGFTYYVQAGEFSTTAWLLGAAVGALSTNLLVVNNYRDADTDRLAGKRTLVVRFGRKFARFQYAACLAWAFLVPVYLALRGYGLTTLLALAMTPFGVMLCVLLARARSREDFQLLLASTAKLLLFYSVLLAVGLAL